MAILAGNKDLNPKMAARAGLSASQSFEGACGLYLPHSPHSQESSPELQRAETAKEGDSAESQVKGTLLEWLKVEMKR